jgi:hypothetical protein
MSDLISRQAATTIPIMPKEHRHYQTNNLDDAYEQGWADLQECIENLPPVKPKKGKWIPEHKGTGHNGYYKTACYCSCCKDYYTTSPEEMNFCPNCGMPMEMGDSDAND